MSQGRLDDSLISHAGDSATTVMRGSDVAALLSLLVFRGRLMGMGYSRLPVAADWRRYDAPLAHRFTDQVAVLRRW